MRILFTSHRVENLQFFVEFSRDVETVILEEPENEYFPMVLSGEMDVGDYLELIDTQFPVYTERLLKVLSEMRDKRIVQMEPYLQEVEKLRYFNRGDESVREMERKVNLAYIDYAESFLKGDFDELVDKVVVFAEADAERFVMRDKMRAKAISELEGVDNSIVEAGVMHTKLLEYLNDLVGSVDSHFVPELVASKLNMEYVETPGNTLTKSFIDDFDCDRELLAAQSLIYVSIVEKKEMLPDEVEPFPHFIHEQKIIRFVRRLSYDKCRKLFQKIWHSR